MSVSHLARLLESGEYRACLNEAAALLEEGDQSAESLARIQGAICRSRLSLTDYFGAVRAGQEAVRLADEARLPDQVGAVLADLGLALSQVRRYEDAVAAFERFTAELDTYTAARCLEGLVLQRMAAALHHAGRPDEAASRYEEAWRWFRRFGDEATARDCASALIRLRAAQGQPESALPLIREGDRYAQSHPEDSAFLWRHLLDRALTLLALGRYDDATVQAFGALETAADQVDQQAEAQLLLARIAAEQQRPAEALSFALAARVSAIDGRLYRLESEAAALLFRMVQEGGEPLLRQADADLYQQGVSLAHYLSEQAITHALRTR